MFMCDLHHPFHFYMFKAVNKHRRKRYVPPELFSPSSPVTLGVQSQFPFHFSSITTAYGNLSDYHLIEGV